MHCWQLSQFEHSQRGTARGKTRGLYYKIYNVVFTPSYSAKSISMDALHRYLLWSVRGCKNDVVIFIILSAGIFLFLFIFSLRCSAIDHSATMPSLEMFGKASYEGMAFWRQRTSTSTSAQFTDRCCNQSFLPIRIRRQHLQKNWVNSSCDSLINTSASSSTTAAATTSATAATETSVTAASLPGEN